MTKYFLLPMFLLLALIVFIALIAPSKKLTQEEYCQSQNGNWQEAEQRCKFD